jgi:hypothetical protein
MSEGEATGAGSGAEREGAVGAARLFEEALPVETRCAVLATLVDKAVAGDLRVAEFLFERLYGRPGPTPRTERAEGDDAVHLDLSELDDGEIDTLVHLLGRCKTCGDPAVHPA